MPSVQFTSNLPEVANLLGRAAGQIVIVMEEEMAPLAEEVAGVATSEIAGATPRRTGHLAASTTPITRVSGLSAEIGIIQPAVSEPNQYSGRGGGFPYAIAVINGRRAVVPLGKNNGGADVLWGNGFGPAKRSRATSANPYPDRGMAAAEPQIVDLVATYGEVVAARIARIL